MNNLFGIPTACAECGAKNPPHTCSDCGAMLCDDCVSSHECEDASDEEPDPKIKLITFAHIEEKIKTYDNSNAEPRRKPHDFIIDSKQSVDWNREAVLAYNRDIFPNEQKIWQERNQSLKQQFKQDLITVFLQLPDMTEARAEIMFNLANDYGIAQYALSDRYSNSQHYHILQEAKELASIFLA